MNQVKVWPFAAFVAAFAVVVFFFVSSPTISAQRRAKPKMIYIPPEKPRPTPTPKQTPKPEPKVAPNPAYLMFKVTISGGGDTGDGTVWRVYRTYESDLITLAMRGKIFQDGMTDEEVEDEISNENLANRGARDIPVRVTIHDRIYSEYTEPCPDPAEGDRTVKNTKKWIGEGTLKTAAMTSIRRFRNRAGITVYNIDIPLFGSEAPDKPIVYTESTTSPPALTITQKRRFTRIPVVPGILSSRGAIHHSKNQPLDIVNYTEIEFDESYTPGEELLPGVRDSRYESRVIVQYKVSSTPFKNMPKPKDHKTDNDQ